VSNKVHKFAVIRNEPRELDVIDEAKAERAMQTIVPQFYRTGGNQVGIVPAEH
jgi:hypothetical protein